MAGGEASRVSTAAAIVAGNLRVDAASAEVLRAFEAAGVHSLLLKGPSLARWLYEPGEPRSYVDCDLLVRPADQRTAEVVLTTLGFRPTVEQNDMPDWWHEHAIGWLRPVDGAIIDLHRTLVGVGTSAERVWLSLSAQAETVVVGGFTARTPNIPARAFHLALHAAQHGVRWENLVPELDRAIARTDASTWRAAAGIAADLDALPAFATGLRMAGSGRALADDLSLPEVRPVDVALRAATPPPVALGFEQLARADGWPRRVQIIARKVVPPTTFMRAWSPMAHRGRVGLLLAYAWRPIWLLRCAPAGFRAWRAARRSMGGERATARPRRAARWPRRQ
jgi:Uncharacterised nucleotidyltransferase